MDRSVSTDDADDQNRPCRDAIKHARISRDITQKDLAARLGVRHMTVSDWERGVVECGDRALWMVANALDTTAVGLLREYFAASTTEAEAWKAWKAARNRPVEKRS